ncbi:MAG: hypothetical protein DCC57_02755 [Chloroflexi bacterium]|nr:MAG: hypothetical protein DCC57_02755 [Chloroflexota bacterium]
MGQLAARGQEEQRAAAGLMQARGHIAARRLEQREGRGATLLQQTPEGRQVMEQGRKPGKVHRMTLSRSIRLLYPL